MSEHEPRRLFRRSDLHWTLSPAAVAASQVLVLVVGAVALWDVVLPDIIRAPCLVPAPLLGFVVGSLAAVMPARLYVRCLPQLSGDLKHDPWLQWMGTWVWPARLQLAFGAGLVGGLLVVGVALTRLYGSSTVVQLAVIPYVLAFVTTVNVHFARWVVTLPR